MRTATKRARRDRNMDITEEQMPPTPRPSVPEKGVPPKEKPDRGSNPDLINPEEPDEQDKPVDPIPEMDPAGQDPNEDEVIKPVKGSALDIPVIRHIGMVCGQSHITESGS